MKRGTPSDAKVRRGYGQTLKRLSTIVLDKNGVPKTWELLGYKPVPFEETGGQYDNEYAAYLDKVEDYGDLSLFYNFAGKKGKIVLESLKGGEPSVHSPTAKTLRTLQENEDGSLRHISGPDASEFAAKKPVPTTPTKRQFTIVVNDKGEPVGLQIDGEVVATKIRPLPGYDLLLVEYKGFRGADETLRFKMVKGKPKIDVASAEFNLYSPKPEFIDFIPNNSKAADKAQYLNDAISVKGSYSVVEYVYDAKKNTIKLYDNGTLTSEVPASEAEGGEKAASSKALHPVYVKPEMGKVYNVWVSSSAPKKLRDAYEAYKSKIKEHTTTTRDSRGLMREVTHFTDEGKADAWNAVMGGVPAPAAAPAAAAEPAPEPKKKFVIKKKAAPPLAPIKGKFAPQLEAIPERDEPLTPTAVPARKKFVIKKKPEPPARPLSEFEKAKKVGWGLIHHIYRFHKITTDYGHFGV
jgi:hypothetical protein